MNFRAHYFERHTERVVFQMTNVTALCKWFDGEFDVNTIVLLRHPIPTALSIIQQGWEPEDWEFVTHDGFVARHLTTEQLACAKHLVAEGSLLERHVLDWALKMLVPVRALESGLHPDWQVVTYEQMVLEPIPVLQQVAAKFDFPHLEPMLAQVRRPSRSVTPETADRVDDAGYLLDRWRERITSAEESQLLDIPRAFGLDVYEAGRRLAASPFLLDPSLSGTSFGRAAP